MLELTVKGTKQSVFVSVAHISAVLASQYGLSAEVLVEGEWIAVAESANEIVESRNRMMEAGAYVD